MKKIKRYKTLIFYLIVCFLVFQKFSSVEYDKIGRLEIKPSVFLKIPFQIIQLDNKEHKFINPSKSLEFYFMNKEIKIPRKKIQNFKYFNDLDTEYFFSFGYSDTIKIEQNQKNLCIDLPKVYILSYLDRKEYMFSKNYSSFYRSANIISDKNCFINSEIKELRFNLDFKNQKTPIKINDINIEIKDYFNSIYTSSIILLIIVLISSVICINLTKRIK